MLLVFRLSMHKYVYSHHCSSHTMLRIDMLHITHCFFRVISSPRGRVEVKSIRKHHAKSLPARYLIRYCHMGISASKQLHSASSQPYDRVFLFRFPGSLLSTSESAMTLNSNILRFDLSYFRFHFLIANSLLPFWISQNPITPYYCTLSKFLQVTDKKDSGCRYPEVIQRMC